MTVVPVPNEPQGELFSPKPFIVARRPDPAAAIQP